MLTANKSFFQHQKSISILIFIASLVIASSVYITYSSAEEATVQQSSRELFTSIDSENALLVTQGKEKIKDPTILRACYVRVNFDYLVGEDYPEGRESIILNLFNDLKVIGIKDRMERRSSERYTWFGHIKEVNNSQIIIVVEGDVMAANITIDGRMFQVRAIGNGVHAIYEIDQTAFPDACNSITVVSKESNDLLSSTSSADVGPYIDVLVVYSDDAARNSVNINTEIQLAIAETNHSYSNSDIYQRLRLIHSEEVNYAETGDLEADLNCITLVDGCLDEVHQLRDDYGADMVSFWVESGNYCGIAWIMAYVSHYFEEYAFSVVRRDCATGYYAFGHELGHNMGAHHDRANASGEGAYPYSYGYQDPQENWRTIMAYNCPTGCPIVQYWSNPDITYYGTPMGIPAGEPDSADNHRTLNNTAFVVSGFRPCRDDDNDGYPHYDNCGAPVDCNDSDPSINPGAEDFCDGIDNDCDGTVDEDYSMPEISPPLVPGSVKQGEANLDVTINGSGFVSQTICEFCDRVILNSCTYESANRMMANISIDSSTELGLCEVSIINPECGSDTCPDCFEIIFNCQKADIEEDGRIDGVDLAFLGRAFGMNESNPEIWWHEADLDGNGWVDGDDLALLAANFGESPSTCE